MVPTSLILDPEVALERLSDPIWDGVFIERKFSYLSYRHLTYLSNIYWQNVFY